MRDLAFEELDLVSGGASITIANNTLIATGGGNGNNNSNTDTVSISANQGVSFSSDVAQAQVFNFATS